MAKTSNSLAKRAMAFALSAALAFSMMPAAAFGVGASGADEPGDDTAVSEEVAERGSTFEKKSIGDIYQAGNLEISEADNLKVSVDSDGYLHVSGKPADLNNALFTVNEPIEFEEGIEAERFTFDALALRKKSIDVAVFLDDAKSPFFSTTLKRQKKEDDWTPQGDITSKFTAYALPGKHSVSWKFTTQDTSKETEVMLRSFEFVQDDGLPTLYFDIDETLGTISAMNGDSSHDTECYGSMTMRIPKGYKSEFSDEVAQETNETTYELDYIRGRGNSTWDCDKKPYKVKLDKKADLLGMGANKHWVLLANRYDNSKLRNAFTYWLARQMGMEFSPECEFVDVVMNGEYYGSYYLCEQIRVGDSRVAIDDLEDAPDATEEPEITGGYLLSMGADRDETGHQTIRTDRYNEFLIENPEFAGYFNEAQYNYISNYIQSVEDAIYNDSYVNSDGVSYSELMDIASTIGYFWVQEVSKNGDAYISNSTYLYKKRDVTDEQGNVVEKGKLYWGPLWDFDYVAWGATDYSDYMDTEGFTTTDSVWFRRLLSDSEFKSALVQRWNEQIKPLLLEAASDGGIIDQYAQRLRISEAYDLEKWGMMDYSYYDYYGNQDEPQKQLTFDEEVARLKTWVNSRVDWVSENLDYMTPETVNIKYVVDGKVWAQRDVYLYEDVIPLLEAPEKSGYVFAGWSTKKNDVNYRISSNMPADENMTLYGVYVKKSKEIKIKNIYFQRDYSIHRYYHYDHDSVDPLAYSVYPDNATRAELTWSSDNEDVATINAKTGIIKLKGYGQATITATSVYGVSASYTLYAVSDDEDIPYAENLVLHNKSLTMKAGQVKQLKFSTDPEFSECWGIWFSSSNEDVAKVDDAGVITAVGGGTCKITVSMEGYDDPIEKTCKVTVKQAVKKGKSYSVGNLSYKVTKLAKGKKAGTVTVEQANNWVATSYTVPNSIKLNGKTYKVTAIGKYSFAYLWKLKQVTIGKNVRKINAYAFWNCKKLKTVVMKCKKLKKIGKGAFKDINKKARFNLQVSKPKVVAKKLTKKVGFKKTMKVYSVKASRIK